MNKRYNIEFIVGLFVIVGVLSFIALAFKVSGLTSFTEKKGYNVSAEFINIGSLKVRAPVNMAGVKIGEVKSIELNPQTFYADVTLRIDDESAKIPTRDTTARILTEGLLGSNYISIEPGFEDSSDKEDAFLHDGSRIQKTQPAMILENIIGQFLFSINK